MRRATENWLKIAKAELNAARTLLQHGNYLKAVEHCHAALEKLLKGIITENDLQPSKAHDLLKLASEAVIDNLQADIKKLLNELNNVYMSTRYPDDFDMLVEEYGQDRTEEIVKETERVFGWLKARLR